MTRQGRLAYACASINAKRGFTVAKMTFAYACARLKEYFLPKGFEAVLDTPDSISARVFDTKTGEDFAVLSGLPWSATATDNELLAIIDALEEELHAQEFVHAPRGDDVLG